jgi:hypothetical protein
MSAESDSVPIAISPESMRIRNDSLSSKTGGVPGLVATSAPRSAWIESWMPSLRCRFTLRISAWTSPWPAEAGAEESAAGVGVALGAWCSA